jgi:xylulokinase
MALSVMEGVALSARWAFEELQKSSGVTVSSVSIGGGGSRSDLWCQIRADVLNCVLKRVVITEAAALGAAILAGIGCGLLSSAAEAIERLVHFDRSFEPDAATRDYYNDRYAQYRELYEALRPLNASFPA